MQIIILIIIAVLVFVNLLISGYELYSKIHTNKIEGASNVDEEKSLHTSEDKIDEKVKDEKDNCDSETNFKDIEVDLRNESERKDELTTTKNDTDAVVEERIVVEEDVNKPETISFDKPENNSTIENGKAGVTNISKTQSGRIASVKDDKDLKIEDLQKKLKTLKIQNDNLEKTWATLSTEKKKIDAERNDLKVSNISLVEENGNLKVANDELLKEKKEWDKTRKKLEDNIAKLNSALKSNKDYVRKQNVELQSKVDKLNEDIETIKSQNIDLTEQNLQKSSAFEEVRKENEKLIKDLIEKEELIHKFEKLVDEKQKSEFSDSEVNSIVKEHEETKIELQKLLDNQKEFETEAANYRKMIDDAKGEQMFLENKMNRFYSNASKFNDVLTCCLNVDSSEDIDILQDTIAEIEKIADTVIRELDKVNEGR